MQTVFSFHSHLFCEEELNKILIMMRFLNFKFNCYISSHSYYLLHGMLGTMFQDLRNNTCVAYTNTGTHKHTCSLHDSS